jgi:hypothetical protein
LAVTVDANIKIAAQYLPGDRIEGFAMPVRFAAGQNWKLILSLLDHVPTIGFLLRRNLK